MKTQSTTTDYVLQTDTGETYSITAESQAAAIRELRTLAPGVSVTSISTATVSRAQAQQA